MTETKANADDQARNRDQVLRPPRPTSLAMNVSANLAGNFSVVILGLVAVPIVLKIIGVEAYGLIGMFMSIAAFLSLLDLGLSTTLNRALAQTKTDAEISARPSDLLRTFETVYWFVAAMMAICLQSLAPWIASYGHPAKTLDSETIVLALIVLGQTFAVGWPGMLYAGGLAGLQRQVSLNVVRTISSLTQTLGGIGLLLWVSPSLILYLYWNLVIAFLSTLVLRFLLRRSIRLASERPAQRPRFSLALLFHHGRFSLGILGIALIVTLLTQLDRVILSGRLTLEAFGYYAFAANIATMLAQIVGALTSALFPQLAKLVSQSDDAAIERLYHTGCQVLAIAVLPFAVTSIVFAKPLLESWLSNPDFVDNTYRLVQVLLAGAAISGLVSIPYHTQIAYGWTRLSIVKNVVAIIVIAPLMWFLVGWFGAIGAGVAVVALNLGYLFVEMPIMHARIMRGNLRRFYTIDVALPTVICMTCAGLSRLAFPASLGRWGTLVWIGCTGAVCLAVLAASLPEPRSILRGYVADRFPRFRLSFRTR